MLDVGFDPREQTTFRLLSKRQLRLLWVKEVSSNRAADRQPNPQQETLDDRLSHFVSLTVGRVDHASVYVRMPWANRMSRQPHFRRKVFD
jgi:hypothetical protein